MLTFRLKDFVEASNQPGCSRWHAHTNGSSHDARTTGPTHANDEEPDEGDSNYACKDRGILFCRNGLSSDERGSEHRTCVSNYRADVSEGRKKWRNEPKKSGIRNAVAFVAPYRIRGYPATLWPRLRCLSAITVNSPRSSRQLLQ